ncbi:metastasis suppressor protein 1 isoform X1 [Xiphophorus maculatus]|uniref:metastasis suppressor protein 1 isoform X1 n=1 Tax=Xiphophorus maculatus TaxID=8083 RepID=UPI0006D93A52|nr:metastasis suppressor protein 1 isoform X1 [Xiphophorus maculatus]
METVMERECSALGGLFQTVIGDMKGSYPVWDDFISKATKLQTQLRTTVVAVAAFLDAFQKVADLATNSRGGTRDIGSALTRMCMRHRSIEAKLRQFSMVFLDCLINPLQEQMEEWKRVANTLDKDHAKEYKKARQEIKKRSSDTLKLQKKAKKADFFGRGDLQPQLDSAMQDVSDKYLLLEETEKQAVRRALVEERSRFCIFVSMLRPVVDEEMSMLGEITHLQTLTDDLKILTMDPHKLPASSEQVIVDLKGSECTWSYQTPPSSPSTTVSRKSSMCSSLNSVNSSDSRSSGSHCHSPTSHFRYRASSSSSSSVLPQQTPARLSSVSSHDSGFISQDAYQSKSPSPMPPDNLQSVNEESSSSSSSPSHPEPSSGQQQLPNGFDHHAALCLHGVVLQGLDTHLHPSYFTYSSSSTTTSPISSPSYQCVSPTWAWSRSGFSQTGELSPPGPSGIGVIPSSRVPSWKDWAKPGPYDQPMVNTLRRSKDRRDTTDPSSHQGSVVTTPVEDQQGIKGNHTVMSSKGEKEAHEELARALARGLQLDIHGSSRDSLQGSSGYSSQTNTPCCSEDTIPSQVSDCDYYTVGADQEGEHQSDFDKSSTIPRNSDISQSYRRMFQSKRPASTAGLPSNHSAIITPGVATIRRTPSSKPNLRRPSGGLNLGPIPIKPPMIPVKTPTVPEHPGFPSRAEDGNTPRTPFSPPTTPLSPSSNEPLSPKSVAWGTQQPDEGSDPPTPPPQPGGRLTEWERRPLPELLEETEYCEMEDFLVTIRRGVKLKKTMSNDRSAPIIH